MYGPGYSLQSGVKLCNSCWSARHNTSVFQMWSLNFEYFPFGMLILKMLGLPLWCVDCLPFSFNSHVLRFLKLVYHCILRTSSRKSAFVQHALGSNVTQRSQIIKTSLPFSLSLFQSPSPFPLSLLFSLSLLFCFVVPFFIFILLSVLSAV